MKTILFTILICLTVAAFSQKNTAYISINPNRYIFDSGIGLMYERQINDFAGFCSIIRGKYLQTEESSTQHITVSAGVKKQIYRSNDYKFSCAYALNYSDHITGSFGCGAKIDQFAILILYDPFVRNSQLNIGYNF